MNDKLKYEIILDECKSAICETKGEEALVSFEIDGKLFEAYKAKLAKCPRCWKFKSVSEEKLCSRCDEVLN